MSFWDKLGQAWDSLTKAYNESPAFQEGGILGPGRAPALDGGSSVGNLTPGLAWEAAKSASSEAVNPVGFGLKVSGVENAGQIVNGIYRGVIARPISTALQVTNQPTGPNSTGADRFATLFNADAWAAAWKASSDISPGQANIAAVNGLKDKYGRPVGFDTSPEAQAARDTFFKETWGGKIASGSLDLTLNLTADPTYLGSKAWKAAQVSRLTIKPGEVGAVAAAARAGEITGAKRVDRGVRLMDNWIASTEPDRVKNAAEILADPRLKNNPAGAYVASLLDQANKSFPGATEAAKAARRDAKLDILLTLTGDSNSLARLQARQGNLADALERISLPPVQSKTVDDWGKYWTDLMEGGDPVHPFAAANPATELVPRAIENQRTAIMQQIKRLDEIAGAQGSVSKVGLDTIERAGLERNIYGLRMATIRQGFFNRPTIVIGGAVGTRLDGHVNLRNPMAGQQQLDEALKQAPYLTGPDRADLMTRWAKAVSDGDRQGVVRAAEAAIVRSTAQHYGLSAAQAEALIKAGEGTRKAVYGVMRTRLYSAIHAGDHFVAMNDPERDISVVKSLPVARSQIEDFHPLVDPRQLDRLFQNGLHTRFLENLGAVVGKGAGVVAGTPGAAEAASALGRNVGTRIYSITDPAVGLTIDGLSRLMRLWKDLTLIPRAVAYGTRIQMDTQARLGVHMGMLNYLGALPASLRYAVLMAKDGKLVFKPDTVKVLTPWLTKMGFSEDEAGAVIRDLTSQGGSMADLLSNASYTMHQKLMATDNWGVVNTNDPLWMDGYIRAVRQIRHSPIMQEIIKGADDTALTRFVHSTKEGRAEWLELQGTWGGDLDAYLSEARQHVDYYLPDATTKSFALKSQPFAVRDVTEEGIRRYFDGAVGVGRRMQIHGEAYAPNTVNKYGKFIEDSREHLYTLIADAPETVLGRMPLFVHEFKKEYGRILANIGATPGGATLEQAAMARATATRIAKRNVTRVLFDSSHTSNLAYHFRLVSPFFAAWEDMMKKWGRLIYDNPEAVRRLQQMWDAPTDAGITQDEYGNQIRSDGGHYLAVKQEDGSKVFRKLDPKTESALIGSRTMVVVPLSFIPKNMRKIVGAPKDFKFDQKSFNVIFQGDPPWLPGTGPMVAVAANAYVRSMWPEGETNPVIRYLLPYGTNDNSAVEQVMPAWARNLKKSGVGPFGDNKDLTQTMDILYKEEYGKWKAGKRKTEPTLPEIANQARNWYLMRFYTSLVSPFTATPSYELQFYIDQAKQYKQLYGNVTADPKYKSLLADYTTKYGAKDAAKFLVFEHPEFQSAEQRFYKDFPEYFNLYQSLSTNETGLVANLATVSKMKQYSKEVSKYSEWAWAIAGADNAYGLDPQHAFNNAAYNYQSVKQIKPGSSDTFRGVLPPDEALGQAEAARGWIQYSQLRTTMNLILQQAGLTSLNQSAAAPLKKLYDAQVEALGQENGFWLREFGQRDENKAVAFMRDMSAAMKANPKLAKEPQMAMLQNYIQARAGFMEILKATGAGIDAQQNDALAQLWGSYVQSMVQNSPGFEQIYNRILEQDQLRQEVK